MTDAVEGIVTSAARPPFRRPRGEQPGTPCPALSQFARTHAHETLVWAGKRGARHTFKYDAINSRDPAGQVGSVWRIPPISRREKLHGRHPTQKPLRLVRRALVAER
ncbi:MAG: hypothetical protein H0U02_01510 [Rubrobacter sp.]|nr:hypothetical protein [Rubrobacter sp.]